MSKLTAATNTILYDLDGTLIDHFGAIYKSYCYAQQEMGLEPVSFEMVKASVGGSVPVTMGKLLGEDRVEEGVRHFRVHFEKVIFEDLFALPGAHWLLESLQNRGYTQAVFTNKSGSVARRVCDYLGLTPYLHSVTGTEDTAYRKPQPAFSEYILKHAGAEAATTLLIGDSPYDLEAAAVVGIQAVAVTTGSHDEQGLANSQFPPIEIYPDLYQLGADLFELEIPADANQVLSPQSAAD